MVQNKRLAPVHAEREERTVEVQTGTPDHPEREAVEGSSRRVEVQAKDKRNSSEQVAENLESHFSIEFDISTVQALAEKYPQILPNTKIEIPN